MLEPLRRSRARRAARLLGGILTSLALATPGPLRPAHAKVGYGYKKSEDPLVLGVKRIVLFARTRDWKGVEAETAGLGWQFSEFREDLRVDPEKSFSAAVASRSLDRLAREICRLMYLAVVQKFHWNLAEGCRKYVPARSRVEAALFYYEEILSIGVRDFDRKNETRSHETIQSEFKTLRHAVGTAGLFGIGARKPDLKRFETSSELVLELLRQAFPYLEDPNVTPEARQD